MSGHRRPDGPDFYLRYLLDYPSPELDREVRACRTVRWLHVDTGPHGTPGKDPSAPSSVLRVAVEPPLLMGKEEHEVMLGPYYPGTDLVLPQDRSLLVRIHRVIDWSGVSAEDVQLDVLHTWWPPADIAPTLSLLPLTPEQSFQKGLHHLRRYAAREGHTDVPPSFKMDGYNLGTWVENMRRYPQPADHAALFVALPGWRWLSCVAVEILKSFAQREGHTDPPATYVAADMAVENLVQQVRTQYARGLVSPEEVQRLEEIPYWHW